jgi:serine protease Do
MSLTLRTLAPAIIVVAAATSLRAQTVHTGALESSDPVMEDGAWVDEYTIEATAGQEIVAVVTSVEFDPYVIVTGPSGEQTENDDFGSSREVSLVEAIASESGTWRVQVSSYEAGQSGAYAVALTSRMRTDATILEEEFTVTGELPAGPTASVSGVLDAEDQKRSDESWYEGWSIEAQAGDRAVLVLQSPDFDAYLTLVSPTGRAFNDDDGGGGTDSRLDMTFDEAGRWTVVANTLNAGDTGGYTLSVERP